MYYETQHRHTPFHFGTLSVSNGCRYQETVGYVSAHLSAHPQQSYRLGKTPVRGGTSPAHCICHQFYYPLTLPCISSTLPARSQGNCFGDLLKLNQKSSRQQTVGAVKG